MNKRQDLLFRVSLSALLVFFIGCNATQPAKVDEPKIVRAQTIAETSDTRPLTTTLTAYTKGLSVEGIELEIGIPVELSPGTVLIEYRGTTQFSKVLVGASRRDYDNVKKIACVALLPLCPAIMSINTSSNQKAIIEQRYCEGKVEFEVLERARYITKIIEDEATYPTLQIKEEEPDPYRVSRRTLHCETKEQTQTE